MSGTTILIAIMAFIILLLALGVLFIVSISKAAIKSDNNGRYRKLATDATNAQQETVQLNEKLVTEMEEMKNRLASIERILKEVE